MGRRCSNPKGRGVAAAFVLCAGATFAGEDSPGTHEALYDELPAGAPRDVAQFYYRVGDVPGVADWAPADRERLVAAVTGRHKNRLVNRASDTGAEDSLRYVERLAGSPLAQDFPHVVPQTCAQYGLLEGACEPHRGYVRRVLVLEEMLAQNRTSLDNLERELTGATRPKLTDAQ